MVVKFHWLKGGGGASLAAICGAHYSHGGWRGMETPHSQKKKKQKKGKSKDMATREQVVKQRFTLRTAASALSDEGDSGFLQTRGP